MDGRRARLRNDRIRPAVRRESRYIHVRHVPVGGRRNHTDRRPGRTRKGRRGASPWLTEASPGAHHRREGRALSFQRPARTALSVRARRGGPSHLQDKSPRGCRQAARESPTRRRSRMIVPAGERGRHGVADGALGRFARAVRGVPGGDVGPRAHEGVRGVEAGKVVRYAALALLAAALWRAGIWLSWGLWAVTR